MPQRAAGRQGPRARGAARRASAAGPERARRACPATALPEPATNDEPTWLEPYPDKLLSGLPDTAPGPEARYESRESISLAFITALQHLPPRQRAALVLRDACGYRAAEAAEILDCSLDTVNGSLKRARAALSALLPADTITQSPLPGSAAERDVVGRFTDAFERGDVATLVAMLTDDAWLTMPPWPLGFRGPAAAAACCRRWSSAAAPAASGSSPPGPTGSRRSPATSPTAMTPAASGQGLIVPTLAGTRISGVTRFLDNGLLSRFGLPASLLAVPVPRSGQGPWPAGRRARGPPR